jgi:ribose transport system permease protein
MGGTSMAGGQGGVSGTIIGSLINAGRDHGMIFIRDQLLGKQLVTGIVVVLSVWRMSLCVSGINLRCIDN